MGDVNPDILALVIVLGINTWLGLRHARQHTAEAAQVKLLMRKVTRVLDVLMVWAETWPDPEVKARLDAVLKPQRKPRRQT